MVEVWGEPEGAVSDVALVQWEDASVVTVRANVNREGALLEPPVAVHAFAHGGAASLDLASPAASAGFFTLAVHLLEHARRAGYLLIVTQHAWWVLACAGTLHVHVNGQAVMPGGASLTPAPSESCRLAFVAAEAACQAGAACTALLQLQDGAGFKLEVRCINARDEACSSTARSV